MADWRQPDHGRDDAWQASPAAGDFIKGVAKLGQEAVAGAAECCTCRGTRGYRLEAGGRHKPEATVGSSMLQ